MLPAPAAGAAAAAAGGGGGGALGGTGALAPAPGAQFAGGPRAAAAWASQPLAQLRGGASQPVPDGWGLQETPGLQPLGKEFAHLRAPSRPSLRAAVLCPQRRPRRSCPPPCLGRGQLPKFLKSYLQGLLTHLKHRPPLPSPRPPSRKRSDSPDSEPTWRGEGARVGTLEV